MQGSLECRTVWASISFNGGQQSSIYFKGLDSHGLSLNIYGADGGTVLEFRHYDISKDRSDYALHVISQNENFEERVAQAITMEMLRKGIMR